ncbi:hypothetical protein B0I35DRAFT_453617 [Stachybotrys elegans]|uniref:Histone-lysine N-methyltransferase ASH1L n=1 Tax=Stachybotrys elegans TaxID=80388 RepID=A0A8K0SII9_9HYPO|nr:hypothetical protein B0I35DRAFT_453617 [Stachybotrys elegans]
MEDNFFADNAVDLSSNISSSNLASSSGSTPPTTIADTASLHSDTPKADVITVADDAVDAAALISPEPGRRRRSQRAAPVYNLSKLSGTAGHGKRRAKGDIVLEKRRRTVSGAALAGNADLASESQDTLTRETSKSARRGIDALDLHWSPRTRRMARESPRNGRSSSRHVSNPVSSLGAKLTSMSKRGRKAVDKGVTKMSRELRRLQDTKEFAHVDEQPVVHTVWSNGKYIDPDAPPEPRARKKAKIETPEPEEEEEAEPVTNAKKRRVKKYLDKGLYAGQDAPLDPHKGLTMAEKKKLVTLPELAPSGRINKTMPSPMFTGLRMLIAGRDFKLPYNICNPLPPGQPKPDEWKKMTKNRFIGDSKDYWRKTPHFHDYQSKCVCLPEDGCGESCQNRIMLYECDATNCNVGKEACTNRAFAELTARRSRGGKYRVGVEVIKTSDRGYGVRSNRCFAPNQIIMEYAGEIITDAECERRMNEIYKDNECYYLMSFDQNMIIDATTGSIARFVNHSCNPNCRMIKWIVSGQPRMALFAGDRPIMTGDELTYDYNFDPFSAKNVQACLCGEPNCRGVLGPKSREAKPAKTDLKTAVRAKVKAGKRKIKEVIGDKDDGENKSKKRKIAAATGVKGTLAKAGAKAVKGAATVVKKSVKSITVNSKKVTTASKSPAKGRAVAAAKVQKVTKTAMTKRVVKTYSKKSTPRASKLSLTAVSREEANKSAKKTASRASSPAEQTPTKKVMTQTSDNVGRRSASPRKAMDISRSAAQIRVVTSD